MYYAHRRNDLGQRAIGASLALVGGVGLVWLATNLSVGGGAIIEEVPFGLPPIVKDTPLPPDDPLPKNKTDVELQDTRPVINLPDIPIEDKTPERTIIVETRKEPGETSTGKGAIGGVPGGATVAPPKTVAPAMRKSDLPPYPERSRALREEGLTMLSYCVGVNGRATNVQLAQTSGHRRLDDAAIKWLGQQRFTPGTVDGAASEMCRTFVYEWTLKP